MTRKMKKGNDHGNIIGSKITQRHRRTLNAACFTVSYKVHGIPFHEIILSLLPIVAIQYLNVV
jgi:hypothetical protein